jgi:hypothetical protein
MSVHTFTIDDLMQLDKPTLQYALRVFNEELAGTLALLAATPEARLDEVLLSDLSNLLTLRKVFNLRLEELVDDASGASDVADEANLKLAA